MAKGRVENKFISTHSLTKRLTADRKATNTFLDISTHSLTKRLTAESSRGCITVRTFQLTASRRGWHDLTVILLFHTHFNSQPHEEADGKVAEGETALDISTHSLTKRLTKEEKTSSSLLVFQLTASRRGWPHLWKFKLGKPSISTHSLTKRLTGTGWRYNRSSCISTHSLTKRLTLFHVPSVLAVGRFQLTASRRGWR